MKRTMITSAAVLAAWCAFGVNFASAQFGTLGQAPPRRPAVSPYINLGIGSGAMSYYGLIRPQIDANRSIMNLQNVVQRMNPDGSLQGQIDQQDGGPGLGGLQTGHAATYFNYGHYYPISGSGGTGMGAGGAGGFGPGMGGFNSGNGIGGGGAGAFGTPRTFYGNAMGSSLFQR